MYVDLRLHSLEPYVYFLYIAVVAYLISILILSYAIWGRFLKENGGKNNFLFLFNDIWKL